MLWGFDFNYRGNHNQLVAEALGVCPGLEKCGRRSPAPSFVNQRTHDPRIALDEECRTQCRVGIETRTTPYHIRTGEYQEDQISVYVTARRYGSLDPGQTLIDALDELTNVAYEVLDTYVIESVLEPLSRTISLD